MLAAIAHSTEAELSGGASADGGMGVTVHSDELSSIQVGNVHVFFPRKERDEPEDDEPAEQEEELTETDLMLALKTMRVEKLRRARGGR